MIAGPLEAAGLFQNADRNASPSCRRVNAAAQRFPHGEPRRAPLKQLYPGEAPPCRSDSTNASSACKRACANSPSGARAKRARSTAGVATARRSPSARPGRAREGIRALRAPKRAFPTTGRSTETRLSLDLGGESLLTLDYEGGERVSFGLDVNHQEFPLAGRRLAITQRERRAPPVRPAGRRAAAAARARSSGSTSRLFASPIVSPIVVEAAETLGAHEAAAASGRSGGSGAARDRLALDHRRLYRPRRRRAGPAGLVAAARRPSPIRRRSAMPSARRVAAADAALARAARRASAAAFRRRAKWR